MSASPSTARSIARLAPLPRTFYSRDPRLVARELLGKLLIRLLPTSELPSALPASAKGPPLKNQASPPARAKTILLAGRIVEAEAYLGAIDPGSHAYRGLTPRNAVLFGPPGHAYVYLSYGMHDCTTVSCQPPGCGVLFRALEPVCGVAAMAALRGLNLPATASPAQLRQLTSGPGRLSAALGITRQRYNGCDLCSRDAGLYIACDPAADPAADGYSKAAISATPRINVTSAPHDEWRFLITGNPFVSGKKVL
jgi:DNA-3-methyladenine glycosylase